MRLANEVLVLLEGNSSPFQKRPENKRMEDFLLYHGIKAKVKYISTGSQKGQWLIYNPNIKWYGNNELIQKMINLGFVDFDNKKLSKFSGNGGGVSSICKRP